MSVLMLKLIMAGIFVITGGAVFTDWGRRHKYLIVLSSLVAIVGAYYLAKGVVDDLSPLINEGADQATGLSASQPVSQSVLSESPDELKRKLANGPQVESRKLAIGESWGIWTYEKMDSKYAILRPASGNYESLIRFPLDDTPEVKIFKALEPAWIVVVGQDIDGKESSYYINTNNGNVIFANDDAKDIFWSPSGRYIVSLGGGEVDFYGILDTATQMYSRSIGIQRKGSIFFVKSAPLWNDDEKYFVSTIEEVSEDRMRIMDTMLARVEVPSLQVSLISNAKR
jgi:hypothetical protein